MEIRPFQDGDEEAVVALWGRCGLLRPWNDPRRDIARKRQVQPELFLIGSAHGQVVAAVMAGYDGHRGWMSYLAVDPAWRRRGLGRALVEEVQRRLAALGCPKVNLQVRRDAVEAVAFYQQLGFSEDSVVSLGKRLIPDEG